MADNMNEKAIEALRELYEWYDRDGSVGAAANIFEKHRALLAQRIKHEPSGFDASKLSDGELIQCLEEMRSRDRASLAITSDNGTKP